MSQLKVMPPVAVTVGLVLQLLGVLALQLPRLVPAFRLPALPDGGQPGGDVVVVQRFRPGTQAVGQALWGGGFV